MSIDTPKPSEMRISYDKDQLLESDLADTPLAQFSKWLSDAVALGPETLIEPNAMVIGTSDEQSQVHTRSVLLKGIDERGLTFFTNYGSRKAQDMAANSSISITLPWYPLHRQVNVVGTVTKVSREESEQYFRTRPHGSQLGAIVSAQSSIIDSREILEIKMAELQTQYPEGSQIPMPDFWGGYLITVESMEFWQGRRSRLHDRLRFIKTGESSNLAEASAWNAVRISP
jgi:pyridoxamine 5'-phosphate oxidase